MVTSKTILVVEDDAALRLIVKKSLQSYGYLVLEAEDSTTANAKARMYGGVVDLLLADINLPGLTGGEFAEFQQSFNRNLKVLYMSGAPADPLVRQHLRNKTATFLAKPFTPQELVLAVKKSLEELSINPMEKKIDLED